MLFVHRDLTVRDYVINGISTLWSAWKVHEIKFALRTEKCLNLMCQLSLQYFNLNFFLNIWKNLMILHIKCCRCHINVLICRCCVRIRTIEFHIKVKCTFFTIIKSRRLNQTQLIWYKRLNLQFILSVRFRWSSFRYSKSALLIIKSKLLNLVYTLINFVAIEISP